MGRPPDRMHPPTIAAMRSRTEACVDLRSVCKPVNACTLLSSICEEMSRLLSSSADDDAHTAEATERRAAGTPRCHGRCRCCHGPSSRDARHAKMGAGAAKCFSAMLGARAERIDSAQERKHTERERDCELSSSRGGRFHLLLPMVMKVTVRSQEPTPRAGILGVQLLG